MRVDETLAIPIDASARDGDIRSVTGVVSATGDVLRAPRSGKPCVAFALRIHAPAKPMPFLLGASAPFESFELAVFAVDDPFGRVLVDSGYAEFELPFSRVTDVDDETWRAFCEERGVPLDAKCDEAIIVAGDTITVIGTVERRPIPPDASSGYRGGEDALWLVGDGETPIQITS